MKKIVFVLVGLVITHFFSQAQNIHYGFTAGLVISNYTPKGDALTYKGKSREGTTAGVLLDIPVNKNFTFQPAINFVQKGTKQEEIIVPYTQKTTVGVNYIEIPMNILFNGSDNTDNFFVGAGPSFAIAVSGKVKLDNGINTSSEKIEFGTGDNDQIKGLDLGANFLIGGYFSNGLFLSLNYNRGLSNLIHHYADKNTLKSSYIAIRLGYLFNKKVKK